MATAIKLALPRCRVYGVEPEGADTMHRSFASGKPESIDRVDTIADSLGAPHAAPYSFSLCRRHVDELVKISDDEMRRAMLLMFEEAKLAVEPAGAALCGPLSDRGGPQGGAAGLRRQHRPRHLRRASRGRAVTAWLAGCRACKLALP
ncbi:MAG: pyridoxal-phosphate dependent enzyme [Thermoanaerobaculia bacterium]